MTEIIVFCLISFCKMENVVRCVIVCEQCWGIVNIRGSIHKLQTIPTNTIGTRRLDKEAESKCNFLITIRT